MDRDVLQKSPNGSSILPEQATLANLLESLDQGEPQFQAALDKIYGPAPLESVTLKNKGDLQIHGTRVRQATNPTA